jgi:tetratricopeptide (TPR) repeat protein
MCTGVGATHAALAISTLERAVALTNRIGNDSNRLELLESLAYHYSVLGDQLSRSRALHAELLASSERVQDFERVGWARSRLAWLSMHAGDFPAAIRELDLTFRISAIPSLPQRMRAINWRVHSRAFASLALWVSGYPARATATGRAAFEIAREITAGGADQIFACWWSGYLNLLLHESNTALALSEEIETLAEQHGLPLQKIATAPLVGWVLVQLGQIEAGLSEMLQYKTELLAQGDVFATWLFIALGNAYLAGARAAEGIDAMNEGIGLCRRSGVLMLESELHRLKGELLLSDGKQEAAAESLHDAVEFASHQGAKSWELRATTSLARLLSRQGRRDEAGAMLKVIYAWFTEGFDTADLKEAKKLLEQLSAG